jgi:aryl sulfotransferase
MSIKKQGYWYLASYPKSGNTWCRVFIAELQRLSQKEESRKELNLNRDVETGAIASSRHWLDDQLGINTCDLNYSELDPLRGRAGQTASLFAEGERFHKVHDAFRSPDSKGRPVVCTSDCNGVVYIMRHPEDVAVSLSHFMSWELSRCVDFLLEPSASLVSGEGHGGHQVRQFMGRWDRHVKSWVDQTNIPSLVIRYEDMLTHGQTTFMKLTEFLGLPSNGELVKQALTNTSIERLKKLEDESGGFQEKPDGCDRFFRSGRAGEGAERLTIDQRHRLFNNLEEVMNRFSYGGPDNE